MLGVKWPAHRWRFLWTWIFSTADKVRGKFRQPFRVSEEWGTGQHLPSAVRLNYGTHMYTRWCIPVTENQTRMFYFHAARRATWLGKVHEWAQWHLWHNWAMNKNFSEQDSPGGIHIYYDRPERPSVSDQQTIEWRKLVLSAPELNLRKAPREKEEADRAFEVAKARATASGNGANGHEPAGAQAAKSAEAVGTQP